MHRFYTFIFLAILCCTAQLEAVKNDYTLLITGCPRNGSAYISRVLQHCGLDFKHQRMGAFGTANWILAVPADYTPAAYNFSYCCVPGLNQYRFKHIFHQVRDPLKCISSMAAEMSKKWGFVGTYIQEIDLMHPDIINAARCWYYWNLKAEKIAEFTYRIEDIDKVWDKFCKRLDMRLDKSNLKRVLQNTNSSENISMRVTWKQLKTMLEPKLYRDIANMARRYGYKVTD